MVLQAPPAEGGAEQPASSSATLPAETAASAATQLPVKDMSNEWVRRAQLQYAADGDVQGWEDDAEGESSGTREGVAVAAGPSGRAFGSSRRTPEENYALVRPSTP